MPLHILSPFDSMVIWRDRIKSLFGFDYKLECYTPAAKRKYGYFCLPVLWGDRFIARLDAKADRKTKTLIVHKMIFEGDFKDHAEVMAPLADKLWSFAAFRRCSAIFSKPVAEVHFCKSAPSNSIDSWRAGQFSAKSIRGLWRMARSEPIPLDEQPSYAPMAPRGSPLAAGIASRTVRDEGDDGEDSGQWSRL